MKNIYLIILLTVFTFFAPNTHAQVFISEVFYDSPLNEAMPRAIGVNLQGTHHNGEFVELYNNSSAPFDLSGYSVGVSKHRYAKFIFPKGTICPGKECIVVAFRHPNSPNFKLESLISSAKGKQIFYHADFILGNRGNTAILQDSNKQIISELSYEKIIASSTAKKMRSIHNYNFSSKLPNILTVDAPNPGIYEPASIYEAGLENRLPESQTVSNPSATIGEIKSSAAVSPTGAANVEVPLVFPSGINGMEPKLSVTYSSQSGIGMLGMGADLSGLSVISRTGKNQFIDGKNEAPKFQSDGALTMDGQRLIRTGDGIYQTYLYSLTRIEAAGTIGNGPAYFKVTSPQGLVAEYGTTEDSRVYTEDRNNILSWRVSKVTDLNGNSIQYKYTEDRNKGSYIQEIIYGEEAEIHVTFDYTDKEIPASSFMDGSFFHANLLLSGIKISCPGQNTFRKYSFSYSVSHLSKITEHGTNGEKLALDYEWGKYDDSTTWETILDVEKKDNSQFVTGDVDGDGKVDLVRFYSRKNRYYIEIYIKEENKFVYKCQYKLPESSSSNKSHVTCSPYNVLDTNNDGRSEIVVIKKTKTENLANWELLFYSYDNSFISQTNYASIPPYTIGTDEKICTLNYDNDNTPDLLIIGDKGKSIIICNQFSKDGPRQITLPDNCTKITKALPIDYNGDCISELLIYSNNKWFLASCFEKNNQYKEILNDDSYKFAKVIDINRDGLDDIIFTSSLGILRLFINTGNMSFEEKEIDIIQPEIKRLLPDAALAYQLKNVEICFSDSKKSTVQSYELFLNINSAWYTAVKPDGFPTYLPAEGTQKMIINLSYDNGNYQLNDSKSYEGNIEILPSDFTNDGIIDYAEIINGKSVQLRKYNIAKRNLLYNISSNGIKRTGFDYGTTYNEDLHSCPRNYSVSDLKYLNIPYPLVKTFSEPDGSGQIINTTYKYYNGQYHTYLGILGFDKIEQSRTVEGNVLQSIMERELDKTSFMPSYQKSTSYINGIKTNTQSTAYSISIGSNKIIKVLTDREVSSNELDGLATVKTYTYDEKGRIIKEREVNNDDLSQEITYESYTQYNNPTVITKTRKHSDDSRSFIEKTRKRYNDKSNIISTTEFANTNSPIATSYTYYPNGQVKTKTTSGVSVEDIKESYEYSLTGGQKKITVREALATTESYYNRYTGNLEKETTQLTNGPEAQTTYYGYDGLGRKTSIKYPNGKEWKQTLNWNTKGKGYYAIREEATGEAPVTKYFDILGREIYSTSKQGDVYVENATIYDACGRKISEMSMHPQKAGWTDYYYAQDGRMEKAVTHTGNTETYTYNGRSITTKRNGKTYTRTLDSWGNVLEQTDPSGITVRHTYSSNGQPVTTNAGGHTITMTYDDKGNKLSLNDPDVGETTYRYDGYGRIARYKDQKGEYTLTYDEYGRTLQKKFTEGREINYTYVSSGNGVGLVRSIEVKDGSTEAFEYDKYGQIVRKIVTIDKQDYVYSNIYDNWGRLTRHIAPNGYMLQYTYDNTDSHLTRVADGNNKTLWTYIRNIPGRESSCRLGNQLRSETLSSENEEESILRWIRPNGTALLEMNYSLDPILGNVTSRTEKYAGRSFTENFKYDEMDRLTRISGSSSMLMVYEPNGNITFKQDIGFYRYNDSRRTHALTSIEEPAAQLKKLATQIVTYTEFNKVKSVQEKGYKMVFWYGADEQRIKSELYRNTLRIRTIYYGDGFERHIDANGNSKEYTYLDSDGGYFGMVITENETSSTYYFHTDLLGSLVAISDDNGNIVERRSYDAWGRRRNPNDWTDYNSNRTLELTLIGYTFQEEMPEFNLINLNGRLYDPLLGRMLSPDPFIQDPENSQNYNRYSYAWNNPMKYSDPNGNFIFSAFLGPIGFIIDAACWGAVIGAASYTANIAFSDGGFKNWSWNGLFKSVAIGAISGACGGAAGSLVNCGGIIGGVINGALGGFTGGTVAGSLNAWVNGASFTQGLQIGLKSGAFGAAGGALMGGVIGGVSSYTNGKNIWTGKDIANGRNAFSINNTAISQSQVHSISNEPQTLPPSLSPEKLANGELRYSITTSEQGTLNPMMEGRELTLRPQKINGYNPRLKLQKDIYHNFPTSFDKEIIEYGWVYGIKGNSTMMVAPGYINNVPGIYTIGINNETGIIYHKLFYNWDNFINEFHF